MPTAGASPADEQARLLRAQNEELRAVLARVKEYVGVMKQDKRMRVMAGILLDHVARIEREEAERTARGERR